MAAKVYTVKLHGGRMGIMYGTKAQILREEGSNNVSSIEPATRSDVRWVIGMGGYVPPQAKQLLKEDFKYPSELPDSMG